MRIGGSSVTKPERTERRNTADSKPAKRPCARHGCTSPATPRGELCRPHLDEVTYENERAYSQGFSAAGAW